MPTPATVYLSESNGVGEVVTDNISNCNFGGVDLVDLVPITHPIVRPSVGAGYSFRKFWRIKVQDMGTSALIDNLKFWKTSGALITGEGLFYNGSPAVAYSTPNDLVIGNVTAVPTTEPTQNIPIGGAYAGSINAAPTYSDGYLQVQLWVNYLAQIAIGAVNEKIFIFQWDES